MTTTYTLSEFLEDVVGVLGMDPQMTPQELRVYEDRTFHILPSQSLKLRSVLENFGVTKSSVYALLNLHGHPHFEIDPVAVLYGMPTAFAVYKSEPLPPPLYSSPLKFVDIAKDEDAVTTLMNKVFDEGMDIIVVPHDLRDGFTRTRPNTIHDYLQERRSKECH